MKTLENEVNGTFFARRCENCGKTKPAREVEAFSHIGGASRGAYVLCFDCHGPVIRWQKDADSKVIETPVRNWREIAPHLTTKP